MITVEIKDNGALIGVLCLEGIQQIPGDPDELPDYKYEIQYHDIEQQELIRATVIQSLEDHHVVLFANVFDELSQKLR